MSNMEDLRSDPSFINLAGEIAKRDCVIFVGAGVSKGAGLPDWSGLEDAMRDKAGLSRSYGGPRTADCCRTVIGEHSFNKMVHEQINRPTAPTEAHRRIATLPVRIFVTTNYDTLLENALQEQRRRCNVLSLSHTAEWMQIGDFLPECLVLKIHGCLERTANNLVITEDDYLSFWDCQRPFEHPCAATGAVPRLLLLRLEPPFHPSQRAKDDGRQSDEQVLSCR
jgi:hypothetical protein